MPKPPSSSSSSRGRLFLLLGLFFVCLLLAPALVVADNNNDNHDAGTVTTTTTTTTTISTMTTSNGEQQKSTIATFLNDFFGILDEEEKDFLAAEAEEEEEELDEFRDYYDTHQKQQQQEERKKRKLQGGTGGSTSTTEKTRVNIWQKLKESLGATIIGFILIICMPCLIWKNEGRHVNELVRIDFAKKNAVQVECNSAGDDTVGQLVHFMGPVEVGDSYLDFGNGESDGKGKLDLIEPLPKALILKRTCYIYQKFEQGQTSVDKDRIGGGETRQTTYTLKEDWTTTPQPPTLEHLSDQTNSRGIWDSLLEASVNFQDDGSSPSTPQLPEGMEKLGIVDTTKKPHAVIVAPSAKVGFFGLSRKIVMENMMQFGTDTVPVPNENLPMTVSGCEGLLKGSDNVLRNFPEGAEPFNGAVKVVFEYVQDGFDCSFVVQQTAAGQNGGGGADEEQPQEEAKFGVDRAVVEGKCSRDDLGDIWMVRKGRHGLEEMIDMAKEDEGKITKLLRILCWVGLMAGWVMLFSPFTTALSTLPILGGLGNLAVGVVALIVSCTCACTIMTAAYIRYRPLLAFGLLAIAGGIWGIVAWRLNDAAEEGGEPAAT